MKKVTAALAVLLALTLTGCAGSGNEAGDESTAPVVSESAAPLVAESPTAAPEAPTTDGTYLALVREMLPGDTVIPDATDAQLVDAAQDACEQMNSGVDSSAVDVVEGEQPNDLGIRESSVRIAAAAKEVYCPQGY